MRLNDLLDKCLLSILVVILAEVSGLGDAFTNNGVIAQPNQLANDIYMEETGRALLTGHARGIIGLPF